MTWLPDSIRRRTLFLVLLLLVSMSAVIAWFSYQDATHEIEEIFDARLAQSARILQALVIGLYSADLHADEERNLHRAFEQALQEEASASGMGHEYESKIAFQVWQGEQLLLNSAQNTVNLRAASQPGFGQLPVGDERWMTFTLQTHAERFPFILIVAEREDVRGELVGQVVLQTLIPELVGIPVLALMLWWAVGWGLSPLAGLARQLKAMDAHNLQPIHLAEPVRELLPVQQALNALLADTEARMAREQRLIADAAHELRTPLAILKIHADNALQATAEADRQESLQHLSSGVDRATRLVSQLLTLARLDPELQQQRNALDLLQETRQQLADLMPLAWRKHIELSLDADDGLNWKTCMEDGSLEILLQNLVSNAVKFSPPDSSIDIRWQQQGGYFVLQVIDHGQGINPDQRQRLTERFYRAGSEAGAGLGLSIVLRIVERHSGKLSFTDTPGGGCTVQVQLPAPGLLP